MSISNVDAGLQLDNDTVLLYKSVLETKLVQLASPETITDDGDAAHGLDLTQTNEPGRSWGPQGNAAPTRFAMAFSGGRNSIQEHLVSGTVPAGFLTDMTEDQTWHFLIRVNRTTGVNTVICIVGNSGVETAADNFVFRIQIDTDITVFWETGSGTNQLANTGGTPIDAGEWQVISVVRRERSGASTKFDTLVYMKDSSTYSDSTLIATFDEDADYAQGTGLKPDGGTNAKVYIGLSHNTEEFMGEIGYAVCYEGEQSAEDIDTVQTALLATGQLPTSGISETTFVDWDLGAYPPSLIDESPQGLHAMSDAEADYTSAATDVNIIDLVGSGGRARFFNNDTAEIKCNTNKINLATLLGGGTALESLFNDDVSDPPVYTVQVIGTFFPWVSGTQYAINHEVSGETEPTNLLTRMHAVVDGNGEPDGTLGSVLAEYGAGVNITPTLDSGSSLFTGSTKSWVGRFLWTMRVDEDPLNPGDLRIRHSWNDNLDVLVYTDTNAPTGGEDVPFTSFGPWRGLIQEAKISKVAIPDSQITDDWNKVSAPIPTPTIVSIAPADATTLARADTVSLTVGSLQSGSSVLLWVKYANTPMYWLIYDGSQYVTPFADLSTVTDRIAAAGEMDFVIDPSGGWLGAIEDFQVRAFNGASP